MPTIEQHEHRRIFLNEPLRVSNSHEVLVPEKPTRLLNTINSLPDGEKEEYVNFLRSLILPRGVDDQGQPSPPNILGVEYRVTNTSHRKYFVDIYPESPLYEMALKIYKTVISEQIPEEPHVITFSVKGSGSGRESLKESTLTDPDQVEGFIGLKTGEYFWSEEVHGRRIIINEVDQPELYDYSSGRWMLADFPILSLVIFQDEDFGHEITEGFEIDLLSYTRNKDRRTYPLATGVNHLQVKIFLEVEGGHTVEDNFIFNRNDPHSGDEIRKTIIRALPYLRANRIFREWVSTHFPNSHDTSYHQKHYILAEPKVMKSFEDLLFGKVYRDTCVLADYPGILPSNRTPQNTIAPTVSWVDFEDSISRIKNGSRVKGDEFDLIKFLDVAESLSKNLVDYLGSTAVQKILERIVVSDITEYSLPYSLFLAKIAEQVWYPTQDLHGKLHPQAQAYFLVESSKYVSMLEKSSLGYIYELIDVMDPEVKGKVYAELVSYQLRGGWIDKSIIIESLERIKNTKWVELYRTRIKRLLALRFASQDAADWGISPRVAKDLLDVFQANNLVYRRTADKLRQLASEE